MQQNRYASPAQVQKKPYNRTNQTQQKSKNRGYETFLLSPFFDNLRFNLTSLYKKNPVDIEDLEQNHKKLYSTLCSASEYYSVDVKTVLTSFLNLQIQQPTGRTR